MRSAACCTGCVTGNRPVEAAARVREDTMPPAVQAGDRAATAPSSSRRSTGRSSRTKTTGRRASANGAKRCSARGAEAGARPAAKAPPAPPARPEPTRVAPQPASAPLAFDPVLLKKLETELAQHLGPIAPVVVRNAAKKAKTQAEIVPLLAAEIGDAKAREVFEKKFIEVSKPASQPVSSPTSQTNVATALAASRFPMAVLDKAEQRLAEHIGAVARVVVKRAAMKARDEAELYLLLADEIEDKEEKKAFIRKAASISRAGGGKS